VSNAKSNFWSRFGALEQISPELSVDLGFFGLGSDSPIVLDYRQGGTGKTYTTFQIYLEVVEGRAQETHPLSCRPQRPRRSDDGE
jgi:hypothetical protein